MAILLLAAVAPACVVGAESRPSRDRVVRGPWIPREKTAAGHLVARERVVLSGPRGTEGGAPPKQGMVWIAPYAHWSGVEYQLVPGSWEERAPAYTWRERSR